MTFIPTTFTVAAGVAVAGAAGYLLCTRPSTWRAVAELFRIAFFVGLFFVVWFVAGCTPIKARAEMTYRSETLACTAQAIAADSGREGSEACEREVDRRWHVVNKGALK